MRRIERFMFSVSLWKFLQDGGNHELLHDITLDNVISDYTPDYGNIYDTNRAFTLDLLNQCYMKI